MAAIKEKSYYISQQYLIENVPPRGMFSVSLSAWPVSQSPHTVSSNISVHTDHPGTVQMQVLLSRSGVGPKTPTKLPSDAQTAGPQTTL